MAIRVNIGCGLTPTDGWHNYDNSWSIRLARFPFLPRVLRRLRIISEQQLQFGSSATQHHVRFADATRHIREHDGTVDVLYSSHMLEHFAKETAVPFLREARRVLRRGGIIRIAVPDIKYHVENYLKEGDADLFIARTLLGRDLAATLLRRIKYLIVGERAHQWMYDGKSLCKLLTASGFLEPRIMAPGLTLMPDPGGLDLAERMPESVFVEAINP